MRILSARRGFSADHSMVAFRYAAPDKATAWHAFWEGLPAIHAAGHVQDLTLFSLDRLPELGLRSRPIYYCAFVEEAGEPTGDEPLQSVGSCWLLSPSARMAKPLSAETDVRTLGNQLPGCLI